MASSASSKTMNDCGPGVAGFSVSASQATWMYWPKKIHSPRDRTCFDSHFLRMAHSDSVGDCCRSAASRRKSSSSSLPDSRRILATSEVETASPRPLERTSLDRSKNSRSVSEIRIERVCSCGFRSIRSKCYHQTFPYSTVILCKCTRMLAFLRNACQYEGLWTPSCGPGGRYERIPRSKGSINSNSRHHFRGTLQRRRTRPAMEAWEGNCALAREGRAWSRKNSNGATQGVDPIQRAGVGSPAGPHQIVPSNSQSFDGLAAPCRSRFQAGPMGSESAQFNRH